MGFVKVTFPTPRTVRVNGSFRSPTDAPFAVDNGPNTFDLGAPANYTPLSRTVTVPDRPRDNPLVITFSPAVVMADAVGPRSLEAVDEAIASQHSDIFHRSVACPAAARIVGPNAVFRGEARDGRTLHENCPG